jgi:hypothetical protein
LLAPNILAGSKDNIIFYRGASMAGGTRGTFVAAVVSSQKVLTEMKAVTASVGYHITVFDKV